jgi:hypothetical protein
LTDHSLNREEVVRACDDLHALVDTGPGENGASLAKALLVVARLQAAAAWDYPANILADLQTRLAAWFSREQWRGADAGEASRAALLDSISRLEDAWERPRA